MLIQIQPSEYFALPIRLQDSSCTLPFLGDDSLLPSLVRSLTLTFTLLYSNDAWSKPLPLVSFDYMQGLAETLDSLYVRNVAILGSVPRLILQECPSNMRTRLKFCFLAISSEMSASEDYHEQFVLALVRSSSALNFKSVRIDYATPEIIANLVQNSESAASLTSLTLNCPTCTTVDFESIDWLKVSHLQYLNLTLPLAVGRLSVSSLSSRLLSLTELHITAPQAELGGVDGLATLGLTVLHLEASKSDKIPQMDDLKDLLLKAMVFVDPLDLSSFGTLSNFTWIQAQTPQLRLPSGAVSVYLAMVEGASLPDNLPVDTQILTLRGCYFNGAYDNWFALLDSLINFTMIDVTPVTSTTWPKLKSPLFAFTAINTPIPTTGYFAEAGSLREITMINSGLAESDSLWPSLQLAHYEGVDLSAVESSRFDLPEAYSITFSSCNLASFPALTPSTKLLFLDLSSNVISTGSQPDFTQWNQLRSLDLSSNLLFGGHTSIPVFLRELEYLNLANNKLVGSITSDNFRYNLRIFDARQNRLVSLEWPNIESALEEARLDNNPWEKLPSADAYTNVPSLHTFTISNVSTNSATAPVPTFWANHPNIYRFEAFNFRQSVNSYPALIESPHLRILDLHDTHFTSRLPDFDPSSTPRFLNANFANTKATGTLPDTFMNWAYETVEISNNALTGCFGSFSWSAGSKVALKSVQMRTNMFAGPLPDLAGLQSLTRFDAAGNRFNVCTNPSPAANTFLAGSSSCDLSSQSYTSTCGCPTRYPFDHPCYRVSCDVTYAMPSDAETCAPTAPAAPVSAPAASPPVRLCPGSPPPGSFFCNGTTGTWQNNGSIITPTFSIPPSTSVVITGDLNISTLTLGSGSTVSVAGCVYIIGNVSLTLTEEDIKSLSKTKLFTLLTANTANLTCLNSTDLSTLMVAIESPNLKCKKLNTENKSHRDTLALTLSIDSSACNVWWIILVAVLGGVILLLIIAMLIVTFVPCATAAVRPFWVRSKRKNEAKPGAVA